jgi:CubicO group peptidase (beta-lactamase class C family)
MDSHRKNRMGVWLRRLLVVAAAVVGLAIVLAAVELLGSRGLPARSAPPGAFTALSKTVDSVPGLAVAIADESGLRAEHTWGDADLDTGRRVDPDTLFRVYSLAKPITAVAALVLAERSELELDASISQYVSALPQHLGAASLRQLLAHVAGVRHYDDGEWLPWSQEHCARPLDALPRFINAPLVAAPGESFLYSSFG